MKIVIAGAGSVGRSVALELLDHGHDVTLIDKKPDQLRVASVADAEWMLAPPKHFRKRECVMPMSFWQQPEMTKQIW